MTRLSTPVLLALALVPFAHADVTLRSTTTGKGLGLSGTSTGVTYIKGMKMRTEAATGDRQTVTIFDVEGQKMYLVNDKKKEVQAWDMGAFNQQISQSVAVESVEASMAPNGQTKTVSGQNTDGYDVNITVPATIGGPSGMKVNMLLTGVAWVAKGVPGSDDYAAFYRGAADKGWIFSDPRAAQAQPGQAKALAQMYSEFANLGGIPYEFQTDIEAKGEGVLGAMLSRLGNFSMSTVIDSVDTATIDPALFVPPADYKVEQN
jgi:hypothetical protein